MKNKVIGPGNYNSLLYGIVYILVEARTKAVREINKAQVLAYYEIGREIVEFEQKGRVRAEYGEELIQKLSKDMTKNFGRGFSEINLRNMRRFYLEFPIQIQQTVSVESEKSQTPSGKSETMPRKPPIQQTLSKEFQPILSWSHYCELLKVEEPRARSL
ncbi:MAG: DUF1016 N-terminal domain-containing protein [Thermodesulfobacteriota bacterium]|nr:DUF1016 N-terminal domain-containing protein [Thermodesulfobacteriota bacterium]